MIGIVDFERRVQSVDWSAHENEGFGSIPQTLLELLHAGNSVSSSWCRRLELCVLPQASLVEGTLLAIPFLQELLVAQMASDCIYLLLLYMIICTDDPASAELGAKCRMQLRAGLNTYLADLQDTSAPVPRRIAALDVLRRLTEDRVEWEAVARSIFESESHPALRAEILECLADS